MKKALDILACIVLLLHVMLVVMIAVGMPPDFIAWRIWTAVGLGTLSVSWLGMRALTRSEP